MRCEFCYSDVNVKVFKTLVSECLVMMVHLCPVCIEKIHADMGAKFKKDANDPL